MPTRQTRVFVLSAEPLGDWAETLIGKVFAPLAREFDEALEWFWFSRYVLPANDSADCQIEAIPDEFKQLLDPGGNALHRSMRFRFSVSGELQEAFERRASELIAAGGYCISDFRPYDSVDDTGSNRFLGLENRGEGRREQRAALITNLYSVIAQLVVDALVGPDEQGRFRFEINDDTLNNPRSSTFQSVLHLFCNITDVPTDVYLFHKTDSGLIGCGTFMSAPPAPGGTWDSVTSHPIRY